MATIASVDIALTANSAQLRRGLDEAERSTQRYTRRARAHYQRLNRSINTLRRAFFAFTALLGGAAILQSIDELSTLADQSGINVTRFDQLTYALSRTGINAQQFGNIIRALNTRITQTLMGTGEAAEAFRVLGIDVEALARMTPEDAFLTIVDALGRFDNAAIRAGLASRVLGEELGPRLNRTILAGSDSVRELADSWEGLTEDQIESVRAVNDAFTTLSRSLNTLVASFAPLFNIISVVVEFFGRLINSSKVLQVVVSTGVVVAFGVLLAKAFWLIAYWAVELRTRMYELGVSAINAGQRARALGAYFSSSATQMAVAATNASIATNSTGAAMTRLSVRTRIAAASTRLFRGSLLNLRLAVAAVRGSLISLGNIMRTRLGIISLITIAIEGLIWLFQDGLVNGIRKAANAFIWFINLGIKAINAFGAEIDQIEYFELERLDTTLDGVTESANEAGDAIGDLNFANLDNSAEEFANRLQTIRDRLNPTAALTRRYREEQVLLSQAFEMGHLTAEEFAEAMGRLSVEFQDSFENLNPQELNAFQQATESALDTTARYAELSTNTFNNLADTITNALTGAGASVKEFVQSTLRAFIQLQVRTALFGGAKLFGFEGTFQGRQFGGPVNAGQPYIVGERGPELFVPNQGGNITRNSQIGGGGNVTYNINAVDASSFQQLVASDPSFIYNVTERGRRQSGR